MLSLALLKYRHRHLHVYVSYPDFTSASSSHHQTTDLCSTSAPARDDDAFGMDFSDFYPDMVSPDVASGASDDVQSDTGSQQHSSQNHEFVAVVGSRIER